MTQFLQLLIGSSFVAGVAFLSWLIGVLMGIGGAHLAGASSSRRTDIDELLRRQRADVGKGRPAPSTTAPGGPTA